MVREGVWYCDRCGWPINPQQGCAFKLIPGCSGKSSGDYHHFHLVDCEAGEETRELAEEAKQVACERAAMPVPVFSSEEIEEFADAY